MRVYDTNRCLQFCFVYDLKWTGFREKSSSPHTASNAHTNRLFAENLYFFVRFACVRWMWVVVNCKFWYSWQTEHMSMISSQISEEYSPWKSIEQLCYQRMTKYFHVFNCHSCPCPSIDVGQQWLSSPWFSCKMIVSHCHRASGHTKRKSA